METNTAYELSGIETELVLVHAYRDPDYEEVASNAFNHALDAITYKNDGIMDDVHSKRNTYGADLVVMIIDDRQYCGLGWLGPYYSRMFSITMWDCATGEFFPLNIRVRY